MVLTHQQYLCPDYVNPLTSMALDANKSPLALLAQTCNNIGLPVSNGGDGSSANNVNKTSANVKNLANGVLSTSSSSTSKNINNGSNGGGRNSAELNMMTSSASISSSNASSLSSASSSNSDKHSSSSIKDHEGGGKRHKHADSSNEHHNGHSNNDHHHRLKDGSHKKSASVSNGSIKCEAEPPVKRQATSTNEIAIKSDSGSVNNGRNNESPKNSNSQTEMVHSNALNSSPSTSKHHVASSVPPVSPTIGNPASSLSQNYANFFSHYFPPPSASSASASAAALAASATFPFSSAAAAAAAAATLGPQLFPPGLAAAAAAGCYGAQQQPFLTPGLFQQQQRLCTDPFCKNCPPPGIAGSLLASSLPYAAANPVSRPPCPAGCTQCSLAPSASSLDLAAAYWLNPYSPFLAMHGLSAGGASIPPHPAALLSALSPPGGSTAQAAAAAAAANFLNAFATTNPGASTPAASGAAAAPPPPAPLPISNHICQWNSGEKVCGKVFSSADDLAQHLRTHSQEIQQSQQNVSNGGSVSSTLPSPPGKLSTTPLSSSSQQMPAATVSAASSASSTLSGVGSNSGRLSPRSLQSSILSSSYLNNLNLNALRYHPYKLPGMVGAGLAPPPPSLLPPQATIPYPSFGLPASTYNNLQAAFLGAQKLPASFPQL